MTSDTNDNNGYSAEDVRRYLRGELSAADMHRLEMRALSDPFLADAMKGLEWEAKESPGGSFDKDVSELKLRLGERVSARRPVMMMWWRVAAVLLLVASAVAVTLAVNDGWLLGRRSVASKTGSMSDSSEPPVERMRSERRGGEDMNQKGSGQGASKSAAEEMPNKDGLDRKKSVREPVPPGQRSAGPAQASRPIIAPAPMAAERESEDGSQANNALASRGTPDEKRSQDTVRRQVSRKSIATPAPRVAEDGKLYKADTLRAFAVGGVRDDMQNRTPTASLGDTAARGLDEVVVVGYGKSKGGAILRVSARDRQSAEPEGGWAAFERYIAAHRFDSVDRSEVSGRVAVMFRVDGRGRPADIRILQSVSDAADSAVIGLLNAGTNWTLKSRRRTVTFSMGF